MIGARILAMSVAWVVMSPPVTAAQDLSKYREFQLGMSLVAVAEQAGTTPEARVVHQRPDLIQELMWQPTHSLDASPLADSVRRVLFSFYNGQLFRIVVNYDWERTEGLTVEDMVEVLSVTYGSARLPATEISSSSSRVRTTRDRIVGHWEDGQYSVDLFRPSYTSTFGLVVVSNRLDALARAASVEAIRLDEQELPRRAIDRKQKQEDEDHARQEKARTLNKATFRP